MTQALNIAVANEGDDINDVLFNDTEDAKLAIYVEVNMMIFSSKENAPILCKDGPQETNISLRRCSNEYCTCIVNFKGLQLIVRYFHPP